MHTLVWIKQSDLYRVICIYRSAVGRRCPSVSSSDSNRGCAWSSDWRCSCSSSSRSALRSSSRFSKAAWSAVSLFCRNSRRGTALAMSHTSKSSNEVSWVLRKTYIVWLQTASNAINMQTANSCHRSIRHRFICEIRKSWAGTGSSPLMTPHLTW